MLQPITIKSDKRTIKLQPLACADPMRWVWPLPAIADVAPRVLAHENDARLGVEIGYVDRDAANGLVSRLCGA